MALDPFLLEILVCPETKTKVALAAPELLKRLNAAIDKGAVVNKGGDRVSDRLEQALVREDNQVVYPVQEDVPLMLIDKQIELRFIP